MSKATKVAIISTTPNTVLDDYAKLMDAINYKSFIDKQLDTIVKINLSWSLFYPACSTPPWQLDGVLNKLAKDGFSKDSIIPVENQTVVTHPWIGAYKNKWLPIMKQYKVDYRPLTNEKWVPFEPEHEMLAMDKLFDPILVPEIFKKTNVIHLPTMKTHGHTTTTGAMKNAFGGLIPKYRHHAHKEIHKILVDLLAIQKELHPGRLAVMDGTVAGDGAGPRTMIPKYPNILLASEDQVAIDAVAAKMMGFDPMDIDYIKIAHDKGLGVGDMDQLDIIGMDQEQFKQTNYGFKAKRSLVIRWDQRIRKTTYRFKVLKPFHWLLFYTPIFRLFILTSGIFHDKLWYPITGKKQIKRFKETEWGNLFENYEFGEKPNFRDEKYKIEDWNKY